MKAILLAAGLLVPLAFVSSAARADDPIVLSANREVAVAAAGLDLEYHEFQYNKTGPAPLGTVYSGIYADSRTGWSPGISLIWSDVIDVGSKSKIYVRTSYQYYDWTITYHGYSTAGVIGPPSPSPLKINDVSAELGAATLIGDRQLFAGFLQIEYRDYQRVLANSEMNYKEDYNFAAPGVGMRDTIAFSKRLALSGKLGLEYTVGARVGGSGDPETGFPAVPLKLGSSFLGQGGVGLDYALSRNLALKLEADFSHFMFGHSRVTDIIAGGKPGNVLEPNSVTDQAVTQLGMAWTY